MKKLTTLICLIIISQISNAQVTVQHTIITPTSIDYRYFYPTTVHFKGDSIAKGYGSYYQTDLSTVRFVSDKPTETVTEWKNYHAEYIDFVIMGDQEAGTEKRYGVNFKGCLIDLLGTKEYENNSIILFGVPDYVYCAFNYGKYIIKIKNEKKGYRIPLIFDDSDNKLDKKVLRPFKKCKNLKTAYKKGDFKNSFEGLIKLLDFYDKNCSTNQTINE